MKRVKSSINVRKYIFSDRDGVDKGLHIFVCTNCRGLVVVVGCDGNGELESFPKIHPSFDL